MRCRSRDGRWSELQSNQAQEPDQGRRLVTLKSRQGKFVLYDDPRFRRVSRAKLEKPAAPTEIRSWNYTKARHG